MFEEENATEEQKEFAGNMNVNLLGFQNFQEANSKEISVPDEQSTIIIWNNLITNNGFAVGGIKGTNFIIKSYGSNVLYEFIITVLWKPNIYGFRTISLEDPDGKIINSTFIPDNIPLDSDQTYKHQVIFKVNATIEGGWKIRLYQNSGDPIVANVNMKVIGPIIY